MEHMSNEQLREMFCRELDRVTDTKNGELNNDIELERAVKLLKAIGLTYTNQMLEEDYYQDGISEAGRSYGSYGYPYLMPTRAQVRHGRSRDGRVDRDNWYSENDGGRSGHTEEESVTEKLEHLMRSSGNPHVRQALQEAANKIRS